MQNDGAWRGIKTRPGVLLSLKPEVQVRSFLRLPRVLRCEETTILISMKLVTIVPVVMVLLCLMAAASDENEAATRRWSLLPKRPSTPKWNLSAKPCACPRTYKPLCASNGQTYNNHCAFKCAKQLNATLSVKAQARCDEPDVRDILV